MRSTAKTALLLVVTVCALTLAFVPEAQACWPWIVGSAQCSNGDPAPGEPVSIFRQGDGIFCDSQSFSDVTDAAGQFDICIFCAGTTTVTISGESRTLQVNGYTDFGIWVVPCDADGDGWYVPDDCDDGNANVHPGHAEVCGNGIDDDCDGSVDEGCGGGGGCRKLCPHEEVSPGE